MPTPTPPPSPIPERLHERLPPSADLVDDGIVIDLVAAASAPSIGEAPVDAGMLLVQLGAFGWSDPAAPFAEGEPFLLTADGEWRTFDLDRYGLESPVYAELSSAISRDGRSVAFADPSGVVTVDLRDGTFRRFEPPVHEAVALAWSPDGSSLLLKDRHDRRRPCGPTGCRLDVSTGQLTRVPFNVFYAAYDDLGAVVEMQSPAGDRGGSVVTHPPDGPPTVTPLRVRTLAHTAGGPAAARHVAFAQCRGRSAELDNGVVVVDPTSGTAEAMLTSPHRRCRLGAQAWLDDDHLVVHDWPGGDLWLWEVGQPPAHRFVASPSATVHYQVAEAVMARRFRHLLDG
ncbi:hypothetical protein [Nocardioides ferulae]|uniref:hypothetical protein n=1 Tax=Nocardioides ferulae TaxID=2340821 RepID=UPI000EB1DDC1|nr:hypothetical protein [Nocardioides ferulae]